MSGNIWGCHTECYWHLVGQGQGAAKHLTMHRTVPYNKEQSSSKGHAQSGKRCFIREARKAESVKFRSQARESESTGSGPGSTAGRGPTLSILICKAGARILTSTPSGG